MADKKTPMDEEEIKKFLDQEEKEAVGYAWGELSAQREKNMEYYLSQPFGNEPPEDENRSAVVSSEVFDSVEWMLPSLIRVFAATDKAVEFEAQSEEDEEGARQATQTVNYVFWRQNAGFLILYTMLKDCLIQKNGAVKWWWDKSITKKREKYFGKSMDEITMMLEKDPDNITIVSKSEPYHDEVAAMQMAMAMQSLPPGQPPPQMPPPELYDIEIEVSEETGKCCVAPIPPDELLVSKRHNSILLDDCPYVSHIGKRTLSELRDMGYEFDDEDVIGETNSWIDDSPERIARESKEDSVVSPLRTDSTDPSQRQVWLRESYVLLDEDGDGIAERRRIVRAGNKIFEDELADHVQIAAITPIIMTHRFFGMSIAELVMDLQLLGSTLWRQTIDNLFAANNQGHIVLSSPDGRVQANIDDLLTSRPNRVIREYTPGAVRPDATPWIAHQSFPMLEYIDQQRMNRTGANSMSSGLDADSLNKTARGATLAQNQQQEKIELIARIIAETGIKAMFRGILHTLCKYSTKKMVYRLLNKYVNVDPREWKTSYDMTVNVGIGTGNKDQQLVHLAAIAQAQEKAVGAGGMGLILTPKNIFNVQARIVENAGFKNVEEFWTDPGNNMPPPAPPPPVDPIKEREVAVKEQALQLEQSKVNGDIKQKQDALTVDAAKHLADVDQWNKDRQQDAQQAILNAAQHEEDVKREEENRMRDEQAQADEKQKADEAPLSEDQQLLGTLMKGQTELANHLQALQKHAQALHERINNPPRMRKIPVRDAKTQRILHVDEVPIE